MDWGKEFWNLGNAVTGFAIVQTVAFLIAAGPHETGLGMAVTANPLPTSLATVGSVAALC